MEQHKPMRCFEGSAQPYEPFWSMVDAAQSASGEPEMDFDGYISEFSWWDDDITPAKFKNDLSSLGNGGPVTIRMNSYGGDVIAASKMHSIIKDYPGRVTVLVDAIAASAATVVAMAGDVVKINPTGFFMIHDPSYIFFLAQLNIELMERMADSLKAVKEGIINAYEGKTGLSRARLGKLMTEETWMDAQKAVDLGFVDEIFRSEPKPMKLPGNTAVVNGLFNIEQMPGVIRAAFAFQQPLPAEAKSSLPLTDEQTRKAQSLRERIDKILKKE